MAANTGNTNLMYDTPLWNGAFCGSSAPSPSLSGGSPADGIDAMLLQQVNHSISSMPYQPTEDAMTTNLDHSLSFPARLHYMLTEIHKEGSQTNIVSWQPHGRCFVVHDKKKFVSHILSLWFRQSQWPSFQRQLNLYGFKRISQGLDKGGYYHKFFVQDKPNLAQWITRQKIKGKGPRKPAEPEKEPDFYSSSAAVMDGSTPGPAVASNHQQERQLNCPLGMSRTASSAAPDTITLRNSLGPAAFAQLAGRTPLIPRPSNNSRFLLASSQTGGMDISSLYHSSRQHVTNSIPILPAPTTTQSGNHETTDTSFNDEELRALHDPSLWQYLGSI